MSSGAVGGGSGGNLGHGGVAAAVASNGSAVSGSKGASKQSDGSYSGAKSGKQNSSANKTGNEGKNAVGRSKNGVSFAKGAGGKEASLGSGKKGSKKFLGSKSLYGFHSKGPERSEIPAGANEPRKKQRTTVKTETADPDQPVAVKSGKVQIRQSDIQTLGSLSHGRVGKEQLMCSFGSHRRCSNWIQPGTKSQLLGPFSDHMEFNKT